MAGDSTTNNEIGEGVEQGASVRGERHSRVGGILECDPPGNRNSLSMSDQANENTDDDDDDDGVCRYGVNPANSGMSFIEICQIRLQNFFPHLAPPSSRYGICDDNVELTAEILAHDVIRYLLKEDMYLISRDSISRSMRHNVYQMLNKHSILFTSMVNRLNVVPDTAYEAFTGVADELFLHGEITWAKIVCLYAFMGRLALWARDEPKTHLQLTREKASRRSQIKFRNTARNGKLDQTTNPTKGRMKILRKTIDFIVMSLGGDDSDSSDEDAEEKLEETPEELDS
ncbi:hypothetical protein G9C98_001486, partial [Cotesia typhae]